MINNSDNMNENKRLLSALIMLVVIMLVLIASSSPSNNYKDNKYKYYELETIIYDDKLFNELPTIMQLNVLEEFIYEIKDEI